MECALFELIVDFYFATIKEFLYYQAVQGSLLHIRIYIYQKQTVYIGIESRCA
jgi:hypothetical protein